MIEISELTDRDADEYEAFHAGVPTSLLYTSDRYRRFLGLLLPDSEPRYLIARSRDRIVGALPAFRRECPGVGAVVNSLPFYGSNGGIVAPDDSADQALLAAYAELSASGSAATLVSNPLDDRTALYERTLRFRFQGERIGQFTDLPGPAGDLDDALLARFHQKTRNSVRKGLKSGLAIEIRDDVEALHELARLHRENLEAIGGLYKPAAVFDTLRTAFRFDDDYRVYVAADQRRIVAALLVLYYNRTVEYFTPATDAEFRAQQPMSALIFHAMRDAVRRGFTRWNWGGTWLSQTGVYDFKSRWGTRDLPYFYYTTLHDEHLLERSQETLLSSFPSYFVVPFSELQACRAPT